VAPVAGRVRAIEEQVRTPRAEEIVARARGIIERGAGDRLTMRRLADEMGIQAPSLYKHFADKGAIQRAVYVDYLVAMRDAVVAAREAVEDAAHPLVRVAHAYRIHSLGHRELYAYVHVLPYPRAEAAGVLKDIRMQWFLAAGDSDLALAAYAFMRGMVELEIHSLTPRGAEADGGYEQGLAAFVARAEDLVATSPERRSSLP
jgi:AcrR family transcriptional regulator